MKTGYMLKYRTMGYCKGGIGPDEPVSSFGVEVSPLYIFRILYILFKDYKNKSKFMFSSFAV